MYSIVLITNPSPHNTLHCHPTNPQYTIHSSPLLSTQYFKITISPHNPTSTPCYPSLRHTTHTHARTLHITPSYATLYSPPHHHVSRLSTPHHTITLPHTTPHYPLHQLPYLGPSQLLTIGSRDLPKRTIYWLSAPKSLHIYRRSL